ncbi:MAG: hypothetical protein U1E45_13245 [Geminicoccaceae bacterium]
MDASKVSRSFARAFSAHSLVAVAALALLLPGAAQAQQKAMLEKSATYALDNKIRSFRVPVLDSTGKAKYYDVTVTLTVNTNGTLGSSATVVSTFSPNVTTLVIPPGTYKATDGTTCIVTNMNLTNGRVQSNLRCALNTNRLEIAAATGPVSPDHPFYSALKYASIDMLPEVNTKTWGIVTTASGSPVDIAGCGVRSIEESPYYTISSSTNGNTVTFIWYNSKNVKCGFSIVKQ